MSDFAYHPFPKYLQIREIVRRRLRLLQPGDRLPTESELAAEFGVSRVTVRQVMKIFATEGVIERRPRVGTILRAVPAAPADDRLTGPIEEFSIAGLETTSVVIQKGEVAAERDVASALRIGAPSTVYEVRRVRMLETSPFVVLEAFFPLNVGKKIAAREFPGLFVPLLRKIVDKNIWEEHQEIDALVAGTKFAAALQIPVDAPILCVKRLFLDSKGLPVVYFRENFRADRYFYTIRLPQPTSPSG
ncbi:GntR family transcriptional regulator [Bradyrhizobium sp. LM6.10]